MKDSNTPATKADIQEIFKEFDKVNDRFDGLDGRIDTLDKDLNERIDKLDKGLSIGQGISVACF